MLSRTETIAASESAQSTIRLTCGLAGTGSAVPSRVVDNRQLIADRELDTTPAWIEKKTGVRERRLADAGCTVTSLAANAGLSALEMGGVTPDEIDLIVVATCTAETVIPSVAASVQLELGATNAISWDVNTSCSGFSFALDSVVRRLAFEGRYALVVGADRGVRLADPTDRLTSVFFGDGAGAVLVDGQGGGELLATHLETKASCDALSMPIDGYMSMDGRAVWDYATQTLPRVVRLLCERASVGVDQLDGVFAHQANVNILNSAAEKLGIPRERFPITLDRFGNTVAASIPLTLDDAVRGGQLRDGGLIALVGFGGGLSAGGQLWRIESPRPAAKRIDKVAENA